MGSAGTLGRVTIIQRTSTTLGTELPGEIGAAIAAAKQLVADAAEVGRGGALADVVVEALRAGRNIYGDKTIARAVLDHTLSTVGLDRAARARADDDLRAVIIDHADDLAESWAEALTDDGAALAAAAPAIDDLGDPDIARRGRDAVELWRRAVTSRERFRAAVEGWSMMAVIVGLPANRTYRPFIFADSLVPGRDVDAWAIAQAGLTPGLASPSVYRQRVADLEQAQREEAERADRAREAAGFGRAS